MKHIFLILALFFSIQSKAADFTIEISPAPSSVGNSEISSITSSKISDFISSVQSLITSALSNYISKSSIPVCSDLYYLNFDGTNLVCLDKKITNVFAHLWTGSGQTILGGGPPKIINFDQKISDTKNTVVVGSSWRFIAPEEGVYSVSTLITFAYNTYSAAHQFELYVYKNGTTSYDLQVKNAATTTSQYISLSGNLQLFLLKNEYIDVRILQGSSGQNYNLAPGFNNISISKVGN